MPLQLHAKRLLIILAALFIAGCAYLQQTQSLSTSTYTPNDPKTKMMIGRMAENDGDIDRAMELYKDIDDPFAWLSIARIKVRQKDYPAALSMIEKVIASGSYLDEALELRMQIYVITKQWREAIVDLESLSNRYPDNRNIHIWLANFKLIISDFHGARKEMESITINDQDFMALFILAEACLGDNDRECAKQALGKAINGGTDNPAVFIKLGRIYDVEGNFDAALKAYGELLEIDPENTEAYMSIIDTYLSNDQYKEALEYLQKLYIIDPGNRDALRKIIIIQLENKQFEEALKSLEKQGRLSEMDDYYAAIAYAGLKQYSESLQILNGIQPQKNNFYCDVIMLKATAQEEMGDTDASIETLRTTWEMLKTDKECPEIGYRLATALEESGKRDEGIAVAQEVLKTNPHDSMMLNFIGYVWAEEGINLEKAQSMIEEALKLRPDDGYIMDSMGWVLYKRGHFQEAIKYIEKALKEYPNDSTINTHMGDIYNTIGKSSRALDYYLKAKVNTKKIDKDLEEKIKRLLKKSPKKKGA